MKRSFLLCLLAHIVLFTSCEKYLDIKRSNTQSPIQTANDCQLILDNYGSMNTSYSYDGIISCDDYFVNDAGYQLSTVTAEDRDIYRWLTNAIRSGSNPQWLNPYNKIYLANLVLETVAKLTKDGGTNSNILDGLRGAALFYRAFNHWQVAQLYAKPYSALSSSQDLGIPIRLNSDINDESDRGTLELTYNLIIQDLQEAANLLAPTSLVASRPSKVAAYAMLARVYQSMENYNLALNNASLALAINSQLINYNTLSTSSNTPFSARFNKEVIFQAVTGTTPLLNPGTAGNNVGKIDAALVSSYSSNDLRGKIFLKANSGSNVGTYRFTGNYEPATTANFFIGLAVDELYLIRAESYARSGNTEAALNDLNTLLATRWTTGTFVPMTAVNADAALSLIITERRKELLMRGLRWTDLRRLNKDIRFSKTLNRTILGITYSLLPNDSRYTLLIPTEVIRNSRISQNSR